MPHGTLVMGTIDGGSISGIPQDLNFAVGGVNKGRIVGATGLLEIGGKTVANQVLASYTVTGSAVTSIDFSGLDINAHGGSYEVSIDINNATASAMGLYLFVNNDTTLTNYYNQLSNTAGTVFAGSRGNDPRIVVIDASTRNSSNIQLSINSGIVSARGVAMRGFGATIQSELNVVSKTATVTNITQLTFTASVASSIGVGSQIIIRRKDV